MEKLKYSVQLLGSALVWIMMGALAFTLFLGDLTVWLLTFWWDKRLFWLHRYSIFWAMFHIRINPFWKIKLEGKEHLDKNKVYVIVSNHQSAFDIALLYRINTHFKWVAKRELIRVPVIGWNLLLNKYILIDRKNAFSSKKLLHEGCKNLKMGSSVLVFPEGTRTPDGKVRRFKEGAFLLAKQAQVSILPLVIEGSKDVLPKPGIISLIQTFTIKILPEISYDSFKDTDVAELTKTVNKLILDTHMAMESKWYK